MTQLDQFADQTEAFLSEIDQKVTRLQQHAKLRCKEGCGKCCDNPNVESTVLEVIPLARHLVDSGKAEDIYVKLVAENRRPQCVLYVPDPVVSGNGRCSQYHHRPMICRLFGFSVSKDKEGRGRLASCPLVLEASGVMADTISFESTEGLPVYSESWMALTGVHPEWATQRYPINEAIRLAIEKVALNRQFGDSKQLASTD